MNVTNDRIEGAATEIEQLAAHFGITLNLIMTDVDSTHEPEPSPSDDPTPVTDTLLLCHRVAIPNLI